MIDYLSHRIAPHNPGRAGRIAAWLLICALILGAVGFMLGLMLTIGRAHEATPTAAKPNGWAYPLSCCSNFDCKQATGNVSERPEGFVIVETGEVVGYQDKRIRQSPDGEFHWCAHQSGVDAGRTICLFVPPRSF
jgi:hypothetical protein